MLTIDGVLFIGAFLCFVCAVVGVPAKVNWTALGLALFVLTFLV